MTSKKKLPVVEAEVVEDTTLHLKEKSDPTTSPKRTGKNGGVRAGAGAKRQRRADTIEKQSIAQKATYERRNQELVELVESTMGLAKDEWRVLAEPEKQVILSRVHDGHTVSHVCETLGIKSGLVWSAAYYDQSFGRDLALALEIGQHALVDRMLLIPFDQELSEGRIKLLMEAIKWIAARRGKTSSSPLQNYNERVEVDQHSETINIILPGEFGGDFKL